jgi:hypothetical protein
VKTEKILCAADTVVFEFSETDVVTICKFPMNAITNANAVYSHNQSRDNTSYDFTFIHTHTHVPIIFL